MRPSTQPSAASSSRHGNTTSIFMEPTLRQRRPINPYEVVTRLGKSPVQTYRWGMVERSDRQMGAEAGDGRPGRASALSDVAPGPRSARAATASGTGTALRNSGGRRRAAALLIWALLVAGSFGVGAVLHGA